MAAFRILGSADPLRLSTQDASRRWKTSHASAAPTPSVRLTVNATPETSRFTTASASNADIGSSAARPASRPSPNTKGRSSSGPNSPTTRSWRSSATSRKAVASAPPHAWWESTATPSSAWPAWPAITPTTLMTSTWIFPPRTREVQFDEKWAFVFKKQKNCDPNNPDDAQRGDYWDFVAFDPEHRLVLAVVPGARSGENAQAIVEEVKERTGAAPPALLTSDELPAYTTAIEATFGVPVPPPVGRGPGRPRVVPELVLPEGLCYATVHKRREDGRVVAVE